MKTAKDTKEENIGGSRHSLVMTNIDIVLVGVSPMLMNRMTDEALLGLVLKTKAPKNAANKGVKEQCEEKIYRDPESTICIPAKNLFASLAEAGRSVRLDGKKQVSTADSSKLAAILSIEGEYLPLVKASDNTQPAGWVERLDKGTNPNGGTAVGICRPMFSDWAIRLRICANLAEYQESIVRELFDRAGNEIGLCDWRPQRKGLFGRFRVDKWKGVI